MRLFKVPIFFEFLIHYVYVKKQIETGHGIV